MIAASQASLSVTAGIPALAAIMVLFVIWLVARANPLRAVVVGIVIACIMALEFVLAGSGILAGSTAPPPPLLLMMVPLTITTVTFARSQLAGAIVDNTPFALLIGAQAFRLPLELLMHQAAADRIMPPQMTFTGINFDIVTGITAAIVALLLMTGHAPRWLLIGWSLLGSLLLLSVVIIAGTSMPAIHAFGPTNHNDWVNHIPFVWLPGILVQTALFLHILTWRKLARTAIEKV